MHVCLCMCAQRPPFFARPNNKGLRYFAYKNVITTVYLESVPSH